MCEERLRGKTQCPRTIWSTKTSTRLFAIAWNPGLVDLFCTHDIDAVSHTYIFNVAGHTISWLRILVQTLALIAVLEPSLYQYVCPKMETFGNLADNLQTWCICNDFSRFFLTSRIQLNRINASSHLNISTPALKKRGSVLLALPDKLIWTDLAIHMDVQKNPGPGVATNCQGLIQDSTLRNSTASATINYSRPGISNSRSLAPVSPELFLNFLPTPVFNCFYNRSLQPPSTSWPNPVLNISQRRRQNRTLEGNKRSAEHRNLHNLVPIQRFNLKRPKLNLEFGMRNP